MNSVQGFYAMQYLKNCRLLFLIFLAFLVVANCDDENESDTPIETDEGSWVKYSPIKWTHDGNPISGTFCKVYSDGASDVLKLQCLEFADEFVCLLIPRFNFQVKKRAKFRLSAAEFVTLYVKIS